MIPDMINASFELFAGVVILLSVRRALQDKVIKGVSIWMTAYFTLWGFWNLYYYPYLNQTCSFIGGISVVLANILWLVLMIKYWKGDPK